MLDVMGWFFFLVETLNMNTSAFGQATLTIPGANISIPLSANSLGNLTAHNATNQTTGQTGQNQQTQSQQNQSANQATANQNASNQQNQQSVNFVDEIVVFVCVCESNDVKSLQREDNFVQYMCRTTLSL